jgi:hypothetical protein
MIEREPSPERYHDRRELALEPGTFDEVHATLQTILQNPDTQDLQFANAGPLKEVVIQDEHNRAGDHIADKDVIGRIWSWQNTNIQPEERIDVVLLDRSGTGLATAEYAHEDAVSRIGYISFMKDGADVACSGILWVLSDKRITAQADIVIPTNTRKGIEGLRFAAKIGLSAEWRAGFKEYKERQPVMNRLHVDTPFTNEMGKELRRHMSSFVDQAKE